MIFSQKKTNKQFYLPICQQSEIVMFKFITIYFFYLSIIDFGISGSSNQTAKHPFVAVAASKAPKAEIAETNKAFI